MIYIYNAVTTNLVGYGHNLDEALDSVLERAIVEHGTWVATTFPHDRAPVRMAEAFAYVRIGAAQLVAVGGHAVLAYHRMFAALAERAAEEFTRQAALARDAELDRNEARHPADAAQVGQPVTKRSAPC